jgi:protein phosphatase
VELAIRGGGPDNITCIVADVVDSSTAPSAPGHASMMAGAASNGGRPTIRTDSPAARAHLLSQTTPQPAIVVDHEDPAPRNAHDGEDTEPPPRRRWPIVTAVFVLLVAVVVGGLYLGWRYTQDQYYVGTDGGNVAVFRGINQSVAGINLSHVHDRTDIPISGVPSPDSSTIRATVSASSLAAAQTIVSNIRKDYQNCLAAYTAKRQYDAAQARYRTALHAYVKKYGNAKVQRTAKGKIKATPPPKPTGTPPTIPAGCPGPPGTGPGSGS